MQTFCNSWFLIYTKPQHEKKVADQLQHLNVEYFLPLVKTLRVWSDRKKYVRIPLFPSYIFVKLNDAETYFRTLDMSGVLSYVRIGKTIASVRESIVTSLQQIIAGDYNDIEVLDKQFEPGEKLVICQGPFTGFDCEMIRHNGKRKLLVRIDLIHRNVVADIPVEMLMPASPSMSMS